MFGALTQLIKAWWTQDRIRVARGEGKLLRLAEGDRAIIDDRLFEITNRRESHSSVAIVVYELREVQSDSPDEWQLTYTMQSPVAKLSRNRIAWQIACDKISLLPASKLNLVNRNRDDSMHDATPTQFGETPSN